jgi:lysophospholipase L1-like esterase
MDQSNLLIAVSFLTLAGTLMAPLMSAFAKHHRVINLGVAVSGFGSLAILAANGIDVSSWAGRGVYLALTLFAAITSVIGLAAIQSVTLRVWFGVAMCCIFIETGLRAVPAYDTFARNPGCKFFWSDWVYFKRNNLGYMDRDFAAKAPGTYRILLLGDSFTEGAGLSREQTFGRLMERALGPHAEVYNLGHAGYNTREEADALLRDGPKLDPDMIVLSYVMNDAETHPLQEPFQHFPQWYVAAEHALVQRLGSYAAYSILRRVRDLLPHRFRNRAEYYRFQHDPKGTGWKQVVAALDDIQRWGTEHHTPVIGVVWPMFFDQFSATERGLHATVATELKRHGFETIDLLPILTRVGSLSAMGISAIDEHPNSRANELVAPILTAEVNRLRIPSRLSDSTAPAPDK